MARSIYAISLGHLAFGGLMCYFGVPPIAVLAIESVIIGVSANLLVRLLPAKPSPEQAFIYGATNAACVIVGYVAVYYSLRWR